MKFLETAKHLETKNPVVAIPYLDQELTRENELKLVTKIKNVQLQTYTIKSSINESTMEDLKMFHAVDGESMVKSVLESESLVQRQKKLSDLYKELGEISENELLSKWQKTIKKIFQLTCLYMVKILRQPCLKIKIIWQVQHIYQE